jgi:squalene-associated FAD-dependent desaturase
MFDVAIIGAGFAGLAAGAKLAGAGARVLVLDARPQLGGRATAFVDRHTGELVDNGQHVLFGCYGETLQFLRRIGAEDHVRFQSTLEVPFLDRAGRRSVLRCPPLPSPLHLLAGVLDWDALPWGDRLSTLRIAGPLRRARRGDVPVAPQTVSEWLTASGQGAKVREWLWEPLAVAALNQSPDEAAAAPFIRVLAQMFGPDSSAAAIVLPNRPLHLMYAEPARDFITARGGEVRTNALARLVVEGGRVTAVEIRGDRMAIDRAIAAVPWFALRPLFAGNVPPPMQSIVSAAEAMVSKPIVTVNLWYDRQVMQDAFVGLPGRTMQWVFEKRVAFGEEASHLSVVSSAAGDIAGTATDDLIQLAAAEIAGALPGARHATLVRGTVVREKRATFSLAPGQPPRPFTITPVEGLALAGDWIDTGLPGTIESAVLSGHWAAEEVLTRVNDECRMPNAEC